MGREDKKKKEGSEEKRKLRVLCLHGFRTSGEILKKTVYKWPQCVLDQLDLFFPDGPFPAQGSSDVEGVFDPPYYEWFQFKNGGYAEYENVDVALKYIEDLIIKHGPFDGLLGFSQGAVLSAAFPGLQAQGVAFTKVPKPKFLILISGAKFFEAQWADKAYPSPIHCPSIHFIGEKDLLKTFGLELLKSTVDPVVIHHTKGHMVPKIDDEALPTMLSFLERVQKMVSQEETKESNGEEVGKSDKVAPLTDQVSLAA